MSENNQTEMIKNDIKPKELVYALFYEITSEIKGCKIEIDEDEYQENIRTTPWEQLINYINDSIKILINKKFEEAKNIIMKSEYIKNENKKIEITEFEQYENYIKKLEQKQRLLLKKCFQNKLQNEALENKIGEYMDMEDEFEEMKVKFKYENGRFLDNDRKDNEINILRQENVNLKNFIFEIEKREKEKDKIIEQKENEILEKENEIIEKRNEIIEKKNEINTLKKVIEDLKLKIEEKQKELNLFSNININISNGTNNKNNYSFYNFSHSNSTNNILSGNKYDIKYNNNNINNNNNNTNNNGNIIESYTMNNKNENFKIFHFQKIKSKLLKNKQRKEPLSNTKIDNLHRNKLDSLHKYFINNYEGTNPANLNNSCIKISKLPNMKTNNNTHNVQTNFIKSNFKPIQQMNQIVNQNHISKSSRKPTSKIQINHSGK